MNKKKEIKKIPFIFKFFELQGRMLSHNAGLTKPHPYQSTPITWPFLTRGISYWSKNETREQIYMTGNVFGWWLSVGGIAVYAGIMLADLLARRRGIEPIDERKMCAFFFQFRDALTRLFTAIRHRLISSGGFFITLWLCHYLPFFAMGRSLFLHHYLPAATCNYLLLGAIFQFVFIDGIDSPVSDLSNRPANKYPPHSVIPMAAHPSAVSVAVATLILLCQAAMFIFLSPMTYGTPGMTVQQVLRHKILNTWDLQFGKRESYSLV